MNDKKVLYIASKNVNKIKEIKSLLIKENIIIKSLLDLNNIDDIEETGKTIEENSLIKAKTLSNILKEDVIADDSGLEIKSLNNFPGVYSKRWAHPVIDDNEINELLLKKCKDLKNRKSVLKTVITYFNYNKQTYEQFSGILKGEISNKIIKGNGFGYDHIFLLPNGKLISEISFEEKNKISHRYKAINLLIKWLQNNLKGKKSTDEKY